MLAPAYGLGIAAALLGPWLGLERALTPKLMMMLALLVIAGTVAAATVLLVSHWLRAQPATRRFAAGVLGLMLGTTGIFCLMDSLSEAADHFGEGLPPHILVLVIGLSGLASLHNFLVVAGWLLLPLGLPLTLLFATLIALPRRPHATAVPPNSSPRRQAG